MNIILFDRLPSDNHIDASDFRAEHIRKVLHLQVGDSFKLGEVNGGSGTATILKIDHDGITYRWQHVEDPPEPHPVTLLVAQVRPICMKRILRESVSLGVGKLVIAGSDTGERSYRDAKMWSTGEYRKYLLDGAMQSGQTSMPSCTLVDSFDAVLQTDMRWRTKLVLDHVSGSEPLSRVDDLESPVVIAVGPERGWSDRERKLFAHHGFRFLSLGSRILRTETACSASLAILLGRMGLL